MSCQIVIVLGMHRSGTSAVAGYLHSLGLELPSETLSAHPQDNPEGYFEPQRMVQLNNRLLAELGLTWQSTRPISPDELAGPALDPIKEDIRQYLAETCRPGRKLVFKDPRLCRLLPVWLPLIRQHCETPLVIHTVRSARAVAGSLARRAELQALAGAAITSGQKANLLWLRYNLDAWHHTGHSDLPAYFLSYETFSTSKITRSALQDWLQSRIALPRSKPTSPRPARALAKPTEWPEDQDWQLLLSKAETHLAAPKSPTADEWLANLHALADIHIPAKHQNEPVEPPPESIVIAAMIKHISGQSPKPLLQRRCEPRWRRILSSLKNGGTSINQPEYLFISENPTSKSHIYRVKNPVDALNRAGHRAAWLTPQQALTTPGSWSQCRKLIIHRCEWSQTLASLYQTAGSSDIPIIYDIDDYIFEPLIIDRGYIDFINRLPEHQKQEWKAKTGRFRKALLASDEALAPTHELVTVIEQLGKTCTLKPNGLSPETLALSKHWHEAFKKGDQANAHQPVKRLTYASGTPTHEGDFACFRDAIVGFLNKNEDWNLTIIGALNTSTLEAALSNSALQRLEHRPLVEHANLAYELARATLNLAPLQQNNPFCDAKSALKWFEAAACHVPTLATDTGAFAAAITEGITGFLVPDEQISSETLTATATGIDLLEKVAAQAAFETRENFSESELICHVIKEVG